MTVTPVPGVPRPFMPSADRLAQGSVVGAVRPVPRSTLGGPCRQGITLSGGRAAAAMIGPPFAPNGRTRLKVEIRSGPRITSRCPLGALATVRRDSPPSGRRPAGTRTVTAVCSAVGLRRARRNGRQEKTSEIAQVMDAWGVLTGNGAFPRTIARRNLQNGAYCYW